MSNKIRAVVISPDYEVNAVEIDRGCSDLQSIVGGWIEAPLCGDPQLSFWCNEEGKLNGLPVNRLATAMWHHVTPVMAGHDFMVGNVVITGGVSSSGNTMTLPKNWMKKFDGVFDFHQVDLTGQAG